MGKKQKTREQLIQETMTLTGKSREEVENWFPPEDVQEVMREAQSVINYFESNGGGFYREKCRTCGLEFAYAYHVKAVKFCSIPCISKDLEKIGLKWNPNKTPGQRWGKHVPAIVPPDALSELDQLLKEME